MSGSPLVVSVPDTALLNLLGTTPEGVTFVVWDMTSASPRDTIDLVVVPYMNTHHLLHHLRGVRTQLVQSQSIGYDGIEPHLTGGLRYANAAGVHEASTSELAVALILASQRGVADFVRSASRGQWKPSWRESLADHRVLLVGYGGVGRAIESRLLPFETEIVRLARTPRHDERGVVHGFESLDELLPSADIVVVAVPLTSQTRGLIDDSFLSKMPDGSLVVNVARGPVADTDALTTHARRRRIRLALDVVDPEPLPPGHALFTLANVILTPHVGGMSSAMAPRMAALIRQQVTRLANGHEPLNVVIRT